METDWSLDYCLTCDCQTTGGAYCSQSCRLADLETSTGCSLPTLPSPEHKTSTFWSLNNNSSQGYCLAPAFDFSVYRTKDSSSFNVTRTLTGTILSPNDNTSMPAPSEPSSTSSPRALTPSSSQTSLASMQSTSSQSECISNQARNELRNYTNSFDQVRDWRRKMTIP